MNIRPLQIKVRDLVKGYYDSGEDGVWSMDNNLNIRPPYQREFVYDDRKRDLVIDSIRSELPLNTMYWARNDNGWEVMDGQQRTLSICKYVNGDFSVNGRYYHNLTQDQQDQILDYDMFTVYECDGLDSEKLEWFRRINTAGEPLTEQELLNAVYSGPWLTSAKKYFSKTGCPAYKVAADYIRGTPIRQDYLATALDWVSGKMVPEYMAYHQHDEDAEELWESFSEIIRWVKRVFPVYRSQMKGLDWGRLYREHHDVQHSDERDAEVEALFANPEIQAPKGIYEYVLSRNESVLKLRTFDEVVKRQKYEEQEHRCPMCMREGNMNQYEYKQMDGDHIVPFGMGGRTVPDNCQMLCIRHNRGMR